MKQLILIVCLITGSAAHAQGISTARDGNGNLVNRGAATQTYPSAPMANSSTSPASPSQGSIVINRGPNAVINRRH
jgi:hypothetical protein